MDGGLAGWAGWHMVGGAQAWRKRAMQVEVGGWVGVVGVSGPHGVPFKTCGDTHLRGGHRIMRFSSRR